MPYRLLLDELHMLSRAVGDRPCGVVEVLSMAEAARAVLVRQYGEENMFLDHLQGVLACSLSMSHDGKVHGSILSQMAALVETAEEHFKAEGRELAKDGP